MMGIVRRRAGAVPTDAADAAAADADVDVDVDGALDEDLVGGIDAATDGAEAANEEDELEERGLRVA